MGDRILYGPGANLSPNAWAQVPLLRREEGTTLRDLRSYFSATPAERSVMNNEAWQNLVRTGIQSEGLYVETQSGEINPPSGYDPDWTAWATRYKPNRQTEEEQEGDSHQTTTQEEPGGEDEQSEKDGKPKAIRTDLAQAGVAARTVQDFMDAQGYTWDNLRSCTITSTESEFANYVASIPQGAGEGISISLSADSEALNLALKDMSPQTFKQFNSSVQRMLQLADVKATDVTIRVDASGAGQILGRLNNSHNARIAAEFE